MARVVLLLPTGTYRAPDFVAAARRLGIDVVVASDEAGPLDDSFSINLDDVDSAVDRIVAADREAGVDAVVAVDESGVVIAAEASARLGIPANPPDAVRTTRDKSRLRAALSGAELAQPNWRVLAPDASEDDARAAAGAVGLSCVVKPTGLSASRGVIRVDDLDDVAATVERVRRIAGGGPVVIEAFVPGPEIAVEGLLTEGRLHVLAVFDKPDPLDGPTFPETIYVTPSRLAGAAITEAEAAVQRACTAIGLVDGPVHAELRMPPGGAPVVLEVAARTIGGLCARTLRFGLGMTLEELVLRHAVGLPVRSLKRERQAAGVLMLPVPINGLIRSISGRREAAAVSGIEAVDITVTVGRAVEALPEGDRYLGFVFARGATPGDVEESLRLAWALLRIEIA